MPALRDNRSTLRTNSSFAALALRAVQLVSLIFSMSVSCSTMTVPQSVHFAGISYLGSYAFIHENYPVALTLNTVTPAEKTGKLDLLLSNKVFQLSPEHLRLENGLANIKSGQNIVVTLAIDKEKISEEVIGDITKIIAEISAQILFFDFSTMTLVANYPLSIAKNHVIRAGADAPSSHRQLIEDLYLGAENEKGILDLAAEKLSTIHINEKSGIRFQIKNVSTSENVAKHLPPQLSPQRFNQFLGQYFSAQLANKYDIAVLPYVKGYAIGNKMAGRFSNGDIFNLTLPEPDYSFSITFSNIKQQPYRDGNLLFASRAQFRFEESLEKTAYIDGYFHYAVAKLISKNHSVIDAWSAYEDAIETLLNDLIGQLGAPQREWFKIHGENAISFQQFNEKKELFNAY